MPTLHKIVIFGKNREKTHSAIFDQFSGLSTECRPISTDLANFGQTFFSF